MIAILRNLLSSKLNDPTFYLALGLLTFWILDTYLKIFVKHDPAQMLWWSSAGLGLSVLALFLRNSFLINSLFCALFFHELLWSSSYLSSLLFKTDSTYFAYYMFQPNYPKLNYFVGLFHLLLVPSLVFAIIKTKKIHKAGWIGATIFGFVILFLSYLFSDQTSNLNCIRPEFDLKACKIYLNYLYHLYYLNYVNNLSGIILVNLVYMIIFFIPANLILIWAGKKYHWQIVSFDNNK